MMKQLSTKRKKNLRCGIYTRVSTDMQAEKEFSSCEAQEERILSFIKSQENFKVYEVYTDAGFTGKNTERPELLRMFNDITLDKIDVVISYKIDRISRSVHDFFNMIEIFEKYNISYISVTERFDTSTPSGRLLRNIMLTFAEFEREQISERTRHKLLQRAQRGLCNGGIPSFGYGKLDKKLVIDESESKAVKLIYDTYIETASISEVYAMLKDKGIKYRNNKFVSKTHLYSILRNPVYTGKIVYAGNTYKGIHEPIITDEFFNYAQTLHKNKQCKFKMYKNHLFAGLMKCKTCNKMLTPSFSNKYKEGKMKRYFYYRCTTTTKQDWHSCETKQVSAKRIENSIIENLERIYKDDMYLENLAFRLNHEFESKKHDASVGLELGDGRSNLTKNRLASRHGIGNAQRETENIFEAKTLKNVIFELLEASKNGHKKDRNFYVKKYVKDIIYSSEWIELELKYIDDESVRTSHVYNNIKGLGKEKNKKEAGKGTIELPGDWQYGEGNSGNAKESRRALFCEEAGGGMDSRERSDRASVSCIKAGAFSSYQPREVNKGVRPINKKYMEKGRTSVVHSQKIVKGLTSGKPGNTPCTAITPHERTRLSRQYPHHTHKNRQSIDNNMLEASHVGMPHNIINPSISITSIERAHNPINQNNIDQKKVEININKSILKSGKIVNNMVCENSKNKQDHIFMPQDRIAEKTPLHHHIVNNNTSNEDSMIEASNVGIPHNIINPSNAITSFKRTHNPINTSYKSADVLNQSVLNNDENIVREIRGDYKINGNNKEDLNNYNKKEKKIEPRGSLLYAGKKWLPGLDSNQQPFG